MLRKFKLALGLALLMAASMWFYFQRVLIRYQKADAALHGLPRGNTSDLYPRWWGTHELLLHGRDPYSPEITREIQVGYYGRAIDPARKEDPKDKVGFAYPLYVIFLLAPTIHWPFADVRRGFAVVLFIITAASVPLWLYALRWNPSKPTSAIVTILLLGSLPFIQGFKLQQLTLLVAGLLVGCAAAITGGYLITAGVLLALATIKPHLALLPSLLLLAWVLRDWSNRARLAWAFGVTLTVLLIASELVLPGWLARFWVALQDYSRYTRGGAIFESALTPTGAALSALGLVILSGWLCWPFLQKNGDLGVALALSLALTTLIIPMIAPYNQVLLLAPLLTLCSRGPEWRDWSKNRGLRFLVGIGAAMLFWPWIASIAVMLSSFVVPPKMVQGWWVLPFLSTFTIPIFVFALTAILAGKLRSAPVPGSPMGSSEQE